MWRGWTSWPPRPKIAVVSRGCSGSAGMPAWRCSVALAVARKIAWVTMPVRAVWSERSSTVTAFAPEMASMSSASGNGCSSLTDTTPTLSPCSRNTGRTARTSSVIEPRPTMM